jgi:hypothetical protein
MDERRYQTAKVSLVQMLNNRHYSPADSTYAVEAARQTQSAFQSAESVEMGEEDVFAWWIPTLFELWEHMFTDFSSLQMTLGQVELCFGSAGTAVLRAARQAGNSHRLMHELQIISATCPDAARGSAETADGGEESARIGSAIQTCIALSDEKEFVLNLKVVLDMVSVTSVALREDADYAVVGEQVDFLTEKWAESKLQVVHELLARITR